MNVLVCIFPLRALSAALVLFAAAASLRAQSERFTAPVFRGQSGAIYAGWDDFTHATTANSPDRPGSAASGFAFTQLDPAAFITSSGNLYSFSTILSHRIDVTGLSATPATAVLQTRTLGSALSAPTTQLEYFDGTAWTPLAPPQNELIFAETIGTGFGAALDETRRWTWSLGAVTAIALRVTFQAAGTSQSFQAAALDLAPPAPPDLYATWRSTRFTGPELDNPLVSGPSADPDADGLPNLLEYALGGEPRIPSVTNFQLQIIDSRLRLVFPRITDPALVYTVEASADLVTWEQPPVYTSTGPANIDGPAIALDRVTLGPGHPRRFLRLLVTRP